MSPPGLKRPTRERRGPRQCSPIRSCFRWGLPCRAALSPHAVRSCRTLSPLPRTSCDAVRRSALCCTFRRLTPPRRYLAPCPLKPGLSSTRKRAATVRPTHHQNTGDRGQKTEAENRKLRTDVCKSSAVRHSSAYRIVPHERLMPVNGAKQVAPCLYSSLSSVLCPQLSPLSSVPCPLVSTRPCAARR